MGATKHKEPLTMEQRELVSQHVKLAEKIAIKRGGRRMPPEDCTQEAYFGLIDAARTFEPERGVDFEVYASRRIRGAITDAERRQGAVSLLPFSRLRKAQGVAMPRVVFAGLILTDKRYDAGPKDIEIGEVVFAAPETPFTFADAEAIELALSGLPDRDRKIARAYWLAGLTMKQTGAEVGLGEARVSQIIPGILRRLRDHSALADYAKGA